MKNMNKWQRMIAITASPVLGALLLTSCSGAEAPTKESGPVTIKFGYQTENNPEKPKQKFVKEFEAANPNITVEVQETPTDSYPQVLRTQLQAGNAPDVFYGAPGRGNLNAVLNFASAGNVLDLTQYDWAKKAIPENAKDLFYQDDKLWALPLDLAPSAEVINLTALKGLGIEPATTLDELKKQCKTASDAGLSLLNVAGSAAPNAGLFATQIAASTVYAKDPQWNTKRANNEVTFADSEWKTTLQTIVDLKEAGCFQEGVEAGTFDSMTTAIVSGKSTAFFAPAGASGDVQKLAAGSEIGVGVFPGKTAGDTRLSASPTNALAVNAATEHKEAALKFMEFFAQKEIQDAYAKANGNLSIAPGTAGTEVSALKALEPFLDDKSKIVPLAFLAWPNGDVYQSLGEGVQGLLTGQATVDQVLANLDSAYAG